MNLDRPPFKIIPGQSAQDVAIDIVAAFKSIENQPNRVSRSFTAITDRLAIDRGHPLIKAGFSLAQTVDTGAYTYNNPYHNSQHDCEVMLCSYFLSLLSDLNDQMTAKIILAALIHDFHHDGKSNGEIPFRLELKAIHEATPYLTRAKVSQAQQRCLAALVMATEHLNGINIVHACYLHHTQGHSLPEIPAVAIELKELCTDPVKSKLALILCEADILPSIGLTFEHALRLQDNLSLEWDARLGLEDKLHFIDHNCHAFVVGSMFNSNVEKLRLAIVHQLDNMTYGR